MDAAETLGVLAHPGGMLVERSELTVGLLRATSSPTGLEIELIARRPPDLRSATQRPDDIRNHRYVPVGAARHLLPAADEGRGLRFGQFDEGGRAHWSYPIQSSSRSDPSDGETLRVRYQLAPVFDAGSLVLAWPEIGFPETVVHLSLPDRATVERGTVGIWQAPTPPTCVPEAGINHRDAPAISPRVEVEKGRVVGGPLLLCRAEGAVVVLSRLTAAGPALSMEIRSRARGETAVSITARGFPPRYHESARRRRGASIAVLDGTDAMWLHPEEATASGGPDIFEDTSEYLLHRPDGDTLDLIVGWPAAGLPEVQLDIPLGPAPG